MSRIRPIDTIPERVVINESFFNKYVFVDK
jgi:hypothetical protein